MADDKEKASTSAEEKRDWVGEAVQCFIKDAADIDPTDPVKAVGAYFAKNATDELKARCKAEGKDAKGCWKFVEAVARKALNNHSGHIDPGVVYAIAMHYFEDVPVDWDEPTGKAPRASAKVEKAKKAKKPAETPSEIKKEKERAKKAAKKKAAPKEHQGFFFDLLEMQSDGPNKDGPSSPQTSAGASGEETAMEPSSLPASTSSTESEVQG